MTDGGFHDRIKLNNSWPIESPRIHKNNPSCNVIYMRNKNQRYVNTDFLTKGIKEEFIEKNYEESDNEYNLQINPNIIVESNSICKSSIISDDKNKPCIRKLPRFGSSVDENCTSSLCTNELLNTEEIKPIDPYEFMESGVKIWEKNQKIIEKKVLMCIFFTNYLQNKKLCILRI